MRTRDERTTAVQRNRRAELEAIEDRSDEQEEELLALVWFSDHADQHRAWSWASAAARTRRPVNWAMNRQLSIERGAAPLEQRIHDLAAVVPAATVLIAGAEDPRPVEALVRLGRQLDRPVVTIPGGGHEPWLEEPALFRDDLRSAVRRVS